ncbi:hypothetical protein SMKI_16G0850 [Saccharomyces mikatae IFO 1815]|uniref:Translocation protein SEC62 n=1 Tax=Saccharomyces mikatae IFO 1815 TaxID=226126 RepID=A0AA35IVR9_SACMI|nr:uncharacterized protein SMKI_16G0850 [Saccharomyces mikatae IFO 1815]CAI4036785.1 hypothetical protein SMKI_16G0850 [Saccharomyces mikatae IFO 1815]
MSTVDPGSNSRASINGSATAIASLLRNHKDLKQRQGLFQAKQTDFFRYKRFVRALHSEEYANKSSRQPEVYPVMPSTKIEDQLKSREIFIQLIKAQMVIPVKKLHSQECKEHGLKPSKDFPHLIVSNKAQLEADEYFVWNYNAKTYMDYLIVIGVVSIILALVCYPLWPRSMRRGSYYVSLGAFGILAGFFAVAILRLILYVLSLVIYRDVGGFWIFPNLFEDCGVLESFKPFYGFGEKDTYSYKKKLKRMKKKQAKRESNKKKTINEVVSEKSEQN